MFFPLILPVQSIIQTCILDYQIFKICFCFLMKRIEVNIPIHSTVLQHSCQTALVTFIITSTKGNRFCFSKEWGVKTLRTIYHFVTFYQTPMFLDLAPNRGQGRLPYINKQFSDTSRQMIEINTFFNFFCTIILIVCIYFTGILQCNSILTLSTCRQHQITQVKGSIL